jgi:hypothetical protein
MSLNLKSTTKTQLASSMYCHDTRLSPSRDSLNIRTFLLFKHQQRKNHIYTAFIFTELFFFILLVTYTSLQRKWKYKHT